jgi:hypothetical protein
MRRVGLLSLALALLSSGLTLVSVPSASALDATYSAALTSNVAPSSSQASQWRTYLLSLTGTYSKIIISSSTGARITVTDPAVVPTIAAKLRTSAQTGTAAVSYTIGANTITVGSCGGDLEISIGSGVSNCSCFASGVYTMRPGIGNGNWGGANNETCSQNSPSTGVSQTLSITFTQDAPSPTTFSTTQTSPTNISTGSTITYSLVMSQSVTGMAAADFQFGGTSTCNTPSVSGSGANYTVTVTNCTEGTLILQLKANSVTGTAAGPPTLSSANTVVIDRTAPTISSVTGPANNTYIPGQSLSFIATMSETVTVTGTPRLALTIGTTTRNANYASGTNTRTLTFTYLVQTAIADIDNDGIALSTTLDLNSGTIQDLATNAISNLTFSAPTLTSVLVAQPPAAPTITSITPSSGTLSVAFTAGATNGSAITNYQYSTDNGANWKNRASGTTASPLVITTISQSASSLSNGTAYNVRIRAVNAAGSGDSSTAVAATPSAVVITGDATLTTTYGSAASTGTYSSTGGTGPYAYTLSATPSGVSISGGVVTASASTAAGTYTQNVISTDSTSQTGLKQLTITVNRANTSISIALPSSATSAALGGAVTITATVSRAGSVNFQLGGVSLAGCSAAAAASTTATCSWTPASLGSVALTAIFTPTDSSNFNDATSSPLNITVVNGVSTISLSLAGGVTQVAKGQSINIIAAIDQVGRITFLIDGKRIPGCFNLRVAAIGNRNCSWKPAVQKAVNISARLVPTNNVFNPSTANMNVQVVRRTGTR